MDDLDEVLAALNNLQEAEGLGAVNELLGPELALLVRATRLEFYQAGYQTAREVVLKMARLYWKKGQHKGHREEE